MFLSDFGVAAPADLDPGLRRLGVPLADLAAGDLPGAATGDFVAWPAF